MLHFMGVMSPNTFLQEYLPLKKGKGGPLRKDVQEIYKDTQVDKTEIDMYASLVSRLVLNYPFSSF